MFSSFWKKTPVQAQVQAPQVPFMPQQQQQLQQLTPFDTTSILLFNTAPGKTYDRTFISKFSPTPAPAATYVSDTPDVTSSISLSKVSFRTRMKASPPMFSRMPNYRRFQNEFAGIQAVIVFFSNANPLSQDRLSSMLNRKIRSSITTKLPVAFVLDSTEENDLSIENKLVMESFCASNNVSYFCIDTNQSSQVVEVVQQLLTDIINNVGVERIVRPNPTAPLPPQQTPQFPQLLKKSTNVANTKNIEKPLLAIPSDVLSLQNGQMLTAA